MILGAKYYSYHAIANEKKHIIVRVYWDKYKCFGTGKDRNYKINTIVFEGHVFDIKRFDYICCVIPDSGIAVPIGYSLESDYIYQEMELKMKQRMKERGITE